MSDAAKGKAKPSPLNYARGSWRLGLWMKRGCILGLIVLAGYLVYDKLALRCRLQLRILEAQRTALAHTSPADRVLFESDSVAALMLNSAGSAGGYREMRFGYFSSSNLPAAVRSEVDDVLTPYTVALADLEWWDQRDVPPSAAPVPNANFEFPHGDKFTAFVHERRASGGEPRLVAVTAYMYGNDKSLRFAADVWSTAGMLTAPKRLSTATEASVFSSGDAPLTPSAGVGTTLYSAQPDARDPSRFTIPYKMGKETGVVEGRLMPDDHVAFRIVPSAR
jgi:hypothetical protein